jgi:hypothetical protein
MGRSRSVAFVALVAASLLVFADSAFAQQRVARRAPRPSIWVNGWQLGFTAWTEKVSITRESDSTKIPLNSTVRGVAFGKQFGLGANRLGWTLEIQGDVISSSSESADARLTYFKGGDSAYGASLGAGWKSRVGASRLRWGALASVLYRSVQYPQPAGFQFTEDKTRIIYLGKLEASFPLGNRLFLTQQFSIPLTNAATQGAVWFVGLSN